MRNGSNREKNSGQPSAPPESREQHSADERAAGYVGKKLPPDNGRCGRMNVSALFSRVVNSASSYCGSLLRVPSYLEPLFDASSDFCSPGEEMKSWMGKIYQGEKGETPIGKCMMIGSHDAASHQVVGPREKWQRNQSCGIGRQLEAGARYLDIRLTMNENREFIVHHSSGLGGLATEEFETPLKEFLERNTDEVLWVKLQFPRELKKRQVLHYLDNNFKPILQNYACPQ